MADLYDQDAPDVEDFIQCWMQPVMRSSVERNSDDVLPFCLVARISGADDPDCGTDDPVVQLDFFGKGPQAASIAARDGHRRMTLLARNSDDVTLSDGSIVNADFVETILKPFRMEYADQKIVRYVARYRVGLSYVTVS